MTDEQIKVRLRLVRLASESLNQAGYCVNGVPTEACWDIRFLLAYIDTQNLRLNDLVAQITRSTFLCDQHRYPYGSEDDLKPICPYCEKLEAERLQQELDTIKQRHPEAAIAFGKGL